MELATYTFPPGSIPCEPADYLLCGSAADASVEEWVVYRVVDRLLVKRLVPFGAEPGQLVLEENLLDSVAPAYSDAIYLLLTVFEPTFRSADEALAAIQTDRITVKTEGLLRSARDFTPSHCRLYRP